uniref:Testis-expressed sequence 264 protein n=1 Tax=Ascaris suum TaxID=6253 RepID=F1KY82_ASCSU
MFEFALAFFFLVLLLIALIYKMYRSGLFDDVEIVLTDKPPVMSRPMTIFYKHHIGAYKHAGNLFKELIKLMPSDAITVGIYYDDPEVTRDHLLQSAIGVVYGEDGKDLYPANYAEQLTRWGYERMLMPAVERAIVATQNYESFLSIIALTQFTYSKLKSYVKRHSLNAPISVEFFTGKKIHVVMPLDHHSEFIIPQVMSLEALETKLARRRWDSDVESESCSDPEPDDMEETAPSDAGNESEVGHKKDE